MLSIFNFYLEERFIYYEKGLEEEFEDMAMLDMEFLGQIIVSDEENKKFWLKFKEGKIDYGEGDI